MNRLLLACIVVGAVVSTAGAQNFPNQAIKIIVPFTPGGSNDVVAREIAQGLQTRLKQTAVVENRPGGGGTIAYQFVAKSPPDGHTLMIAPASFTMGPHLSKKPLYHPVKEFAAINLVADVPFVMVVPASLPVKSVKEFIALAKKLAEEADVRLGRPGHAAASRRRAVQDERGRRPDPRAVPRRDRRAPRSDRRDASTCSSAPINSLLPLIEDGKLRALATTSSTAHPFVAGPADHGGGRAARRARSAPASGWSRLPARRRR